MHFCGNPLHDIPLYAMLALPFFAPAFMWLRAKFSKPTCACGEQHEHGEQHD